VARCGLDATGSGEVPETGSCEHDKEASIKVKVKVKVKLSVSFFVTEHVP
jgi:hypothetical protein